MYYNQGEGQGYEKRNLIQRINTRPRIIIARNASKKFVWTVFYQNLTISSSRYVTIICDPEVLKVLKH